MFHMSAGQDGVRSMPVHCLELFLELWLCLLLLHVTV